MPTFPSKNTPSNDVSAQPGNVSNRRSFIEDLQINYGPAGLLGRFLLFADNFVYEHGITLEFAPIAEAWRAQTANRDSWGLFPPMLDGRLSTLSEAMSYCLLGRNQKSEVVAAQCGRIYDLGNRSLSDIVEDHSFFYGEGGGPLPGQPICDLWAPAAKRISGTIVYSGALWVRPDYRGHRLAKLLPRISRSYALARWNTEFTVAFIGEKLAQTPLLSMYGYTKVETGFRITNLEGSEMTGALMWMDRDELAADLARYLAEGLAQVDGAVAQSNSEHQTPTIGTNERHRHT
ncbi:MAG: hypothetical protein HC869_15205 [Rhodospirillales bacterium]|nr:hypothetical protein [Rhodospirillales bacterium]